MACELKKVLVGCFCVVACLRGRCHSPCLLFYPPRIMTEPSKVSALHRFVTTRPGFLTFVFMLTALLVGTEQYLSGEAVLPDEE